MHSSSFRIIHHTSNRRALQPDLLCISKCRSCGSPRRSPVGKDCPKPMPETEAACSSTESCSWALASVHWRASRGWQSDDGGLQCFTWMLFRRRWTFGIFCPIVSVQSRFDMRRAPEPSCRVITPFQRCLRRWVNAQRRWRLNRCGCAKSNIARVWRTLKNWSHTPFPSLSSFWVTRQVRCWNPNSILELPKWQCRMPKIIHKQIKARKGERQIDHPISPALFIAHPVIWCSGCRLWIWADCWSGLLCWWPQYFKVVCSKCK